MLHVVHVVKATILYIKTTQNFFLKATYPSSILTEFMMMQLVILTLSLIKHEVPMTECFTEVFSPIWEDAPTMLSDPTCGGRERNWTISSPWVADSCQLTDWTDPNKL